MPFSALTITRDDINAFEGETFRDLNVTGVGTTLNLSLRDTIILDKAKGELQTDILERLHKLIEDEVYATENELLDAIYDVDTESLLKNVLTYKFLEIWFQQDATNVNSFGYEKFKFYYRKYVHYLSINLRRLAGSLSTPRTVPRYRMRSIYGH